MVDARRQLVAVVVAEQRVAAFEAGGVAVVAGEGRGLMADHRADAADAPLLAGNQRIEGVLPVQARDQHDARGDALQAGDVEGHLGEAVVGMRAAAAGHLGIVVHAAEHFAEALVQIDRGQGAAVQAGIVEAEADAQLADLVLGGGGAEHLLLEVLGFQPGFQAVDGARGLHEIVTHAQAPALVVALDLENLEFLADVDVALGVVGVDLGADGVDRRGVVDVLVVQVAVADAGHSQQVHLVAAAGQVGQLQAGDQAVLAGVLAAVVVHLDDALHARRFLDLDEHVGGARFLARLQRGADFDAGLAVQARQGALDVFQGECLVRMDAGGLQRFDHALAAIAVVAGDLDVTEPAFQHHQAQRLGIAEILVRHDDLDQLVAGIVVELLDLVGQRAHLQQRHRLADLVGDPCIELFAGEGAIAAEGHAADQHARLAGGHFGRQGVATVGAENRQTQGANELWNCRIGIRHSRPDMRCLFLK
ncbi:hypothetical protein D9M71_308720 [compost metagenome]